MTSTRRWRIRKVHLPSMAGYFIIGGHVDYSTFGNILLQKGIADDPAWRDLKVLIAPLPPMRESPLGLYYPDGDPNLKVPPYTIWMPPGANEDTELHELGHRWYHYYYDDLSEKSAEEYRHKFKDVRVAMYKPVRQMFQDYLMSPYQLALIQEQVFGHGDTSRDEILFSDVRYPV